MVCRSSWIFCLGQADGSMVFSGVFGIAVFEEHPPTPSFTKRGSAPLNFPQKEGGFVVADYTFVLAAFGMGGSKFD